MTKTNLSIQDIINEYEEELGNINDRLDNTDGYHDYDRVVFDLREQKFYILNKLLELQKNVQDKIDKELKQATLKMQSEQWKRYKNNQKK